VRVLQGIIGERDSLRDLIVQSLRARRAPECRADVLYQHVHRFAATFGGDQHAVGLLLGFDVTHAKVEQIPGQAQIVGLVRTRAGNVGMAERGFAGNGIDAVGDQVVVAMVVAGLGHQARQHVPVGNVQLVKRQRFFHHLDAPVQVVFQGARNRLVQ